MLAPSSEATESLDVENQGALPWRQSPPSPVSLSYHWLDAATGAWWSATGCGPPFPADIFSGGSARVRAVVRAPPRPGRYVLWWDLVHEHTAWFSERGNPGLREEVVVANETSGQVVAVARLAAPEVVVRRAEIPRG